jgi:small subunit ribosomal protein S4
MARDTVSIVKQSRREGYALHPKAHKYLARRTAKPGQNSNSSRRGSSSQYNDQLREKQKVKRLYGLLEKQFRKLMTEASRRQGESGAVLLQFLEQRLDNAVYRAGFASSRKGARQIVGHGHFMLNGRRVDIPSIRLKPGDEITIREASKKSPYFTQIDDHSPANPDSIPGWISVDRKKFSIKVTGIPTRDNAELDIQEQLIVEYYSR